MVHLLRAWRSVPSQPLSRRDYINKRPPRRIIQALWATCFLSLLYMQPQSPAVFRRSLQDRVADIVTKYNQSNIMETAKYFPMFTPRLLVFDGEVFQAFGIAHNESDYYDRMTYTFRYSNTVPLLVRALKEQFPDRFQSGQPVFQMLFSDADSTNSQCVNTACPVDRFSPILLFGSAPKDKSVFPTLKSFPHTLFVECLYEYKVHGRQHCVWPQHVNKDISWDDLIDTLVWRGSDYPFLDYYNQFRYEGPNQVNYKLDTQWTNSTRQEVLYELLSSMNTAFTPRWRAVLQSVLAESSTESTPWIDARFTTGSLNRDVHEKLADLKGIRVTGERMDALEMSKYKYQIDLGGGGGTTWEGTLTKLGMPGVLFHHETPTKDWFYDMMVPWKHYVPVQSDLGDLQSKWIVATSNPGQMKRISDEASKLADHILSKEYMDDVYQDLFVDYLSKLVRSYTPSGSWERVKSTYDEHGYRLISIGVCNDNFGCTMHCRKGRDKYMPMVIQQSLEKIPSDPTSALGGNQAQAPPATDSAAAPKNIMRRK